MADSPMPNAFTVRIASGGSAKRVREARADLLGPHAPHLGRHARA